MGVTSHPKQLPRCQLNGHPAQQQLCTYALVRGGATRFRRGPITVVPNFFAEAKALVPAEAKAKAVTQTRNVQRYDAR